ncbi:hypothetical protein CPB83DRAFT_906565 [Crepidotus variabilis]|uniref:Uncharacterized protein n=1 Tax=Crepidotus variabilis TaxID=179855 RepID=A0A9P6EH66_9AGAR|nr:hypothetical protein CPB83DRAFT_906565 [Crepidotus variabilis]
MSLPTEIYDLIIDELVAPGPDSGNTLTGRALLDHRLALASCLLVSHSFRERSIRYLFKSVEIKGIGLHALQPALLLITILEGESRLNSSSMVPASHFVKEFHLAFEPECLKSSEVTTIFATLLRLIWTRLEEGFGPTKFTVALPQSTWIDIDPSLQKEIVSLVHSPHLRYLTIKGYSLILPSLLYGSHINTLSLTHMAFLMLPGLLDPGRIQPPRLTQFECIGSSPDLGLPEIRDFFRTLFAELKSFRCISAKRKKKTHLKLKQTHLEQILELSANSLEEISFNISSWRLNHIEDLGIMTNLQHIQLETETGCKTIANLANFFNVKTPLAMLHTISLAFKTVYAYSRNWHGRPPLFESKENGQFLDQSLSSSKYPTLREVLIDVKLGYPEDFRIRSSPEEVRSAAMEEIYTLFPRLVASTRTKFIPTVTVYLALDCMLKFQLGY